MRSICWEASPIKQATSSFEIPALFSEFPRAFAEFSIRTEKTTHLKYAGQLQIAIGLEIEFSSVFKQLYFCLVSFPSFDFPFLRESLK